MPAPPSIELRVPLVDLRTASAALRLDTKPVLRLIESGEIAWAFNVATRIETRQEVRILSKNLSDYQTGATSQITPAADDWECLIKTIFPMAPSPRPGIVGTLRLITIARQFCITPDHAFDLLNAGCLRMIGNTRQRGVQGSPQIAVESAVAFLRKRRIH